MHRFAPSVSITHDSPSGQQRLIELALQEACENSGWSQRAEAYDIGTQREHLFEMESETGKSGHPLRGIFKQDHENERLLPPSPLSPISRFPLSPSALTGASPLPLPPFPLYAGAVEGSLLTTNRLGCRQITNGDGEGATYGSVESKIPMFDVEDVTMEPEVPPDRMPTADKLRLHDRRNCHYTRGPDLEVPSWINRLQPSTNNGQAGFIPEGKFQVKRIGAWLCHKFADFVTSSGLHKPPSLSASMSKFIKPTANEPAVEHSTYSAKFNKPQDCRGRTNLWLLSALDREETSERLKKGIWTSVSSMSRGVSTRLTRGITMLSKELKPGYAFDHRKRNVIFWPVLLFCLLCLVFYHGPAALTDQSQVQVYAAEVWYSAHAVCKQLRD